MHNIAETCALFRDFKFDSALNSIRCIFIHWAKWKQVDVYDILIQNWKACSGVSAKWILRFILPLKSLALLNRGPLVMTKSRWGAPAEKTPKKMEYFLTQIASGIKIRREIKITSIRNITKNWVIERNSKWSFIRIRHYIHANESPIQRLKIRKTLP